MMLKAMINHRLRRCTVFLCTFLLVSYAGFSAAAPPEFAGDKGFPQYVEGEFALVKQMLETNAAKLDRNAQKMDALSIQLEGVKDEIMDILNEPDKDIQLTTEVCFDLGASWAWELTTKGSLGVGWDNVVKIDAFAELSGPGPLIFPSPFVTIPPLPPIVVPFVVPGVSAGVGGNLCVNVPLYSVASNDYWTADFDTEDLDKLIAGAAMPAQYLLPGLANVYGQVAKDVKPAIDFLGDGVNLILAEPGESQIDAAANAVASFSKLMMNSPTLQTMFQSMEEQNATHQHDWWLDIIDPDCNICWVFPH